MVCTGDDGGNCSSPSGGGGIFGGYGVFDLLALAFTPTYSGDFYVQGYDNGEPFSDIINVTVYGNLGLLSLLGTPGGPGGGFAPGAIKKAFMPYTIKNLWGASKTSSARTAQTCLRRHSKTRPYLTLGILPRK